MKTEDLKELLSKLHRWDFKTTKNASISGDYCVRARNMAGPAEVTICCFDQSSHAALEEVAQLAWVIECYMNPEERR